MREDVVTVKPETSLRDALETMLKEKTNALVVTESDFRVAGIITSWGIIEQIVPDYLEDDKHLASFAASKMFEERIELLADKPVSEFMSKNVFSIKSTATLMEAATQISEHHIRQLPVVDQGKLVGYINHTDIKRAIGVVLGFPKSLLK